MNPVLLTGATGFIGRHLQAALLGRPAGVKAVVRPSSKHKDLLVPGVAGLFCDLDDRPRLAQAITESSAVIYGAGSVRGRRLDDFLAANVAGVRAVTDAINRADHPIPLILLSSLAASRPEVSDYANSKFLGEQELIHNARFPWAILRPPAVYGPGDKEMLPILKLARKGLVMPPGPRGQRLSLVHVSDLVSATLACLDGIEQCDGQTFTLDDGHDGGYDWQEIAQLSSAGRHVRLNIPDWILFSAGRINLGMSRILGYAPMLTPGKARELTQSDWVCNNTELTRATGWSPQIGLKQGVDALFDARRD